MHAHMRMSGTMPDMAQQSTIHFFGGAGTVTGSNFMLDTGGAKILIDCGLFQGERLFAKDNWNPWTFDPKEITALVTTHAHIDHIGRIPKLVNDGYRGPIISTAATKALAGPMLIDALELHERDIEKHGLKALFGQEDIAQAMRQWEVLDYHTHKEMGDGVVLEFFNSGHILGSASARFTRAGADGPRAIVFTGDLGGGNSPLLPLAEVPEGAQYLLIESVYGDRKRPDDTRRLDLLENVIEDTAARGGVLLIPAFSTERTQDILFDIRALLLEKRIPEMPVYIDSPLAQKITAAYEAHPEFFADAIRARVEGGEHIFSHPLVRFVESAEESRSINLQESAILIAGSGMSNGGRVVAHEKVLLQDPKATLLIVGYQAAGSLGRQLVEGAKKVRIHEEEVPVRCTIETLYGYSAHMDGEQLLEFTQKMGDTLRQVFVAMGEPAAANFLVQRIQDYLGVKALAPEVGETVTIEL